MKEFKISDAGLQALVADALRKRLIAAGLRPGAPSNDCCAVALPVNLNLAGEVEVERDEDGTWTFRQQLDAEVSSRTAFAAECHASAVAAREASSCR